MRVLLELQQQRFNLRMNKVYFARQLAFSFLKENVCSVLVVELLQLHPPSFVSLARLFGGGGGACLQVTAPAPVGLVSNQ